MKLVRIFLCIGFLLLHFSLCQNLEGEVIDRVVAIVNREIITESELEEALIPLQMQFNQTSSSKRELKQKLKEARSQVLEQLIEKKLLLQKAQEEKIEIYESEVENMIDEIKKRFASNEKFNDWLKTQKLTLPLLKEQLTEQALIRKLINKTLRPETEVSLEEAKIFYEENKDKFAEGQQVGLSYIIIKGPPERKNSEAEDLVREVWAKLIGGVDFDLLAKEYSDGPKPGDGGDPGFINLQTLPPELREIVEKLKVGENSEVIRSPAGFNIIKLTAKKEARKREFVEVKDLIEEQIFRKKLEEQYQRWLEEIKENSFIERK